MSRLTTLLLPLALLLALPAAASGQTFNVGTAGELVAALDAADSNNEDDVIEIAAGGSALDNAAGYAYNVAGSDEDNDLVLNANGRTISGSDPTVILLANYSGTGDVTVNDLHVAMSGSNQIGLDLQARGTIKGVQVTGTAGVPSSGLRTHRATTASDVTISSATQQGLMVEGDTATFTDLEITGATNRLAYSYGTLNIDGATLGPAATTTVFGVVGEGSGQVTVRHASISGLDRPVLAAYSGTVTITDSLLRLPGVSAMALWATDGGSAARNTSTILGERLTIAGTGANSQAVATAEGGSGSEIDEMRITLRDSIVTGVQNGVACNENNAQSVNAITLERVNQAPEPTDENTCDSSPQSGITRTNTTALDPKFVNVAGGDYRLRTDSPLLDRGPAASALPGLPATDLDGAARLNDGDGDCTAELDLGAYETQAPVAAACLPPAAPPAGGGGGGTVPASPAAAADRLAPALTKLKVAKTIRRSAKPPVTIRFRLGEPATVTLRFRRAKGTRFVAVPGTITLKLAAGDHRVRFAGRISKTRRLAAGAHQVVITATDAAGNRAPEQRAGFRLTG